MKNSGKGRKYVSKEGLAFKQMIKDECDRLKIPPFTEEVNLEVKLFFKDRYGRRDLDNYTKVVMDALEQCGVLLNDNLVKCLTVEKHKSSVESLEIKIKNYERSIIGLF